MKETIYVVGHKSPDTDTISSVIAYSQYLKKKGIKAMAVHAGELNNETKYVLKYFQAPAPKLLASAKGKTVILVDHNEKSQSPDSIAEAKIIEVIDHHRITFDYPEPINFHSEPVGSTSTIIAKKYISSKTKISRQLAGLMLAGILSDTVVFRSPTTTKDDIILAKKLAKVAKIKNLEKFGIEIKKQKATLKGLSAAEIIRSDFKDFDFSGRKVEIGQIEVVDLKEAENRAAELIKKMEEIAASENYVLILLMATDIINQGSLILFAGDKTYLEKAFNRKIDNHSFYLKDVLSRKKQIVPPLTEVFRKLS